MTTTTNDDIRIACRAAAHIYWHKHPGPVHEGCPLNSGYLMGVGKMMEKGKGVREGNERGEWIFEFLLLLCHSVLAYVYKMFLVKWWLICRTTDVRK